MAEAAAPLRESVYPSVGHGGAIAQHPVRGIRVRFVRPLWAYATDARLQANPAYTSPTGGMVQILLQNCKQPAWGWADERCAAVRVSA